MKRPLLLFALTLGLLFNAPAQIPFDVSLEEVALTNLPTVQSFAWGRDSLGRILVVAGRADGLHRRQPWASFDPNLDNDQLYVIDTALGVIGSAPLSDFSSDFQDQLQSTNPEFIQIDQTLYFIGGYGYRNAVSTHSTFDRLIAIDVDAAVHSIMNQQNIASHFTGLTDSIFAVTGGYLSFLNDTFYLVGGQYFHGQYNPMGPTHGPGFVQEYTDAVRLFALSLTGGSPTIVYREEWHDPALLHRRDYNLAPQIFGPNDRGFTAFSGVFQPVTDLPWLNMVEIRPTGHQEIPNAQQKLNHYHSAHFVVYDDINLQNHTVFFGGMARFYPDASGGLIDDTDVPFVKTISCISRAPNGTSTESYFTAEMPDLLGSGAEFIPNIQGNFDDQNILHWSGNESSPILAGYIYGGIQSSASNIFFTNTGTESVASNRWFKVWLSPQPASVSEPVDNHVDWVNVYPNPAPSELNLAFDLPEASLVDITLIKPTGEVIYHEQWKVSPNDEITLPVRLTFGPRYLLEVKAQGKTFTKWIHRH